MNKRPSSSKRGADKPLPQQVSEKARTAREKTAKRRQMALAFFDSEPRPSPEWRDFSNSGAQGDFAADSRNEYRADEASASPAYPFLNEVAEAPPSAEYVQDRRSLGQLLQARREILALSAQDLATLSRVPLNAIYDIEAGDFDKVGAPIFLKGYLKSYLKTVGFAEIDLDALLDGMQIAAPELRPSKNSSKKPYHASHYLNPLIYFALTVVVLVPLIYFAMSRLNPTSAPRLLPNLKSGAALTANLDSVEQLPTEPSTASERDRSLAGDVPGAHDEPAAAQSMMASMAPLMLGPDAAQGQAAHRISLNFLQSSWVEFVGEQGERLEFGFQPAGSAKQYTLDQMANLYIGNALGTELKINDQPIDLAPFTKNNAASITIGASRRKPQ